MSQLVTTCVTCFHTRATRSDSAQPQHVRVAVRSAEWEPPAVQEQSLAISERRQRRRVARSRRPGRVVVQQLAPSRVATAIERERPRVGPRHEALRAGLGTAAEHDAHAPRESRGARARARAEGRGPASTARRRHSQRAVSSAKASLTIAPPFAAPPKTTSVWSSAAAAACSPRELGASPVVGCSTSERLAGSHTSTESTQRNVCTRTTVPPTLTATWRDEGPRGIGAVQRDHVCRAKSSTHTSSRMTPPVPAVSGSQPPNSSSSAPETAQALARRPPGWVSSPSSGLLQTLPAVTGRRVAHQIVHHASRLALFLCILRRAKCCPPRRRLPSGRSAEVRPCQRARRARWWRRDQEGRGLPERPSSYPRDGLPRARAAGGGIFDREPPTCYIRDNYSIETILPPNDLNSQRLTLVRGKGTR